MKKKHMVFWSWNLYSIVKSIRCSARFTCLRPDTNTIVQNAVKIWKTWLKSSLKWISYLSTTSNISWRTSWTIAKSSYCNWGLTNWGMSKGNTLVAIRLTERPYFLSRIIMWKISGKSEENSWKWKVRIGSLLKMSYPRPGLGHLHLEAWPPKEVARLHQW